MIDTSAPVAVLDQEPERISRALAGTPRTQWLNNSRSLRVLARKIAGDIKDGSKKPSNPLHNDVLPDFWSHAPELVPDTQASLIFAQSRWAGIWSHAGQLQRSRIAAARRSYRSSLANSGSARRTASAKRSGPPPKAPRFSAVKPWRTALQRERCLPSSVIGPVLLRALRRLASI